MSSPQQHADRFAGRVALVTGASRGIGLGVARRLLDEGARVVITARKPDGLAEAVAALDAGDRVRTVAGRADDADHQRDAVATALDAFGRLDVLVNNTGINPAYGPLVQTAPDAARKIMEVNVLAALTWTARALEAGLGADGAGAVVNMASVAGLYEKDEAAAAARYPLGRLGTPEDVAAAVAFLASADAAWITGQTLVLDGGGSLGAGV